MSADQELYQHVESAIKTVLHIPDRSLSPETSLIQDLGAESIDFLDISCELEKLVHLEMNFRQLVKQLRERTGEGVPDVTVQSIVDYLRCKTVPAGN